MGPALTPVFPPNNSAKRARLKAISIPRLLLLTREKVGESQDLSFMSIQLRAFSYPPMLHSFQICKLLHFPLILHSLPGTLSPFPMVQPLQGPAWQLGCPDLLPSVALTFGSKIHLHFSPALSQPGCPSTSSLSKPLANSMFWLFFHTLANPRSPWKGQVVAPRGSVCSLNVLWPCLRAPQSPQEWMTAPTARLPSLSKPQLANPQKVSTSMPMAMLLLHPKSHRQRHLNDPHCNKTTEVLQIWINFIYTFKGLGFKYWFYHLLSDLP